jgi:hypothetical protein
MHPAAQGRIPAAEIDARTRIILEAPLLRTIIRLAVPNAAVMVTQVSLGLIELYFLEFSAPWSNVLRISPDGQKSTHSRLLPAQLRSLVTCYGLLEKEVMLVAFAFGVGQ